MKLAALVLVVAALGLPINDLPRFALLVVAAVLIYAGTVSTRMPGPWIGARWRSPALRARPDDPAGAAHRGGPQRLSGRPAGRRARSRAAAEAFRLMLARVRRHDIRRSAVATARRRAAGAARAFPTGPLRSRPTAFWSAPAYSRRVSGHRFCRPGVAAPRVHQRAALQLERPTSATSSATRATAASRRSCTSGGSKCRGSSCTVFPADFAGSALCWRGDVLWEGAGGEFAAIRHPSMACRTLAAEDVGRRIFGVAIANDPPLAMRLEPSARSGSGRCWSRRWR